MKAGKYRGVLYAKLSQGWTIVDKTNVPVGDGPWFRLRREIVEHIKQIAARCVSCNKAMATRKLVAGKCGRCSFLAKEPMVPNKKKHHTAKDYADHIIEENEFFDQRTGDDDVYMG